jgi:tetratricopeptide (TPR) repeat protein
VWRRQPERIRPSQSATPAQDIIKRREFVTGLLRETGGTNAALRGAIDFGLAVVRSDDEGRDDARLQMLRTLAESYGHIGDFEQAVDTFKQALDVCFQMQIPDGIEAARCWHGMAAVLREGEHGKEAYRCAERSLELKRHLLGNEHMELSVTLSLLANLLVDEGEQDRGLALAADAVAICKPYPEGEELAEALWYQGTLLRFIGHLDEARDVHLRSVSIHRDLFGRLSPRFAVALNALALCLREMGELVAAKPLYEQILSIYERIYTESHPEKARALHNYGVLLENIGEMRESKRYLELAVAQWCATVGENNHDTLTSRHLLARQLVAEGQWRDALTDLQEILTQTDVVDDAAYKPLSGLIRMTMARAYLGAKDFENAEFFAREALARLIAALSDDNWRTAQSMRVLSEVLLARGAIQEARKWLDRAAETLDRNENPGEREKLREQRSQLEDLARNSLS